MGRFSKRFYQKNRARFDVWLQRCEEVRRLAPVFPGGWDKDFQGPSQGYGSNYPYLLAWAVWDRNDGVWRVLAGRLFIRLGVGCQIRKFLAKKLPKRSRFVLVRRPVPEGLVRRRVPFLPDFEEFLDDLNVGFRVSIPSCDIHL